MTAPTATQDNIEQRRARVAQLRLRGLSSREIAVALGQGDNPMLSPRTGRPYEHAVILQDLKVLKDDWKAERGEATDAHIDREYKEIQEIKRAAWATSDPELALKALDREMKLLGTAKDKDGTVINVYMGIVEQIIMLSQSRNEDPMIIFEGVVRRLQRATD